MPNSETPEPQDESTVEFYLEFRSEKGPIAFGPCYADESEFKFLTQCFMVEGDRHRIELISGALWVDLNDVMMIRSIKVYTAPIRL